MITLHLTYCDDHMDNHYLDERGRCYGESIKIPGYNYVRHIGGGWYEYRPALTLPLDWHMALDEHVHVHELELDF